MGRLSRTGGSSANLRMRKYSLTGRPKDEGGDKNVDKTSTNTATMKQQTVRQERAASTALVEPEQKKCCCNYEFHTADPDPNTPLSQIGPSSLLGGLVAHTTSHGIPHINVARGVVKKSVWTCISLLMVGALVGNLYLIVSTFVKFKVDIVIQMQHQRELTFPAISICNMNPVNKRQLGLVPAVRELIEGRLVNTSLEGQPIPGSLFDRNYPRASFMKEEKMAEILAQLDSLIQFQVGHQPNDTILDCQYSGFHCYYQQFLPYYNPILGNCFVFNSGWRNSDVRVSVKTGRRYGLKMILNINQDLYLPDYTDSAGIRVVIHPQSEMPFPQDDGIVVPPGVLTSIGLRQLSVQRKGDEYGNCTTTKEADYKYNLTRNVFEEYYEVRYSSNACYKTCYQRYLIQRCGCGDAQYPLSGQAFGGGETAYHACSSSNVTEDDCKYNTTTYFNSEHLECPECVLPCQEVTYQPEISSVQWPSDIYEPNVLDEYADKITSITDEPKETKYKRNLMKVEIYYEEFNYENIDERPSYTAGQFASDIGGVLGLWLGWSIMTVFEFIEFLVDLSVLGFLKLIPKKPVKRKLPPLENGAGRKPSAALGQDGGPDTMSANEGFSNKGARNERVLEEDFEYNPYMSLKFV